MVQDAQVERIAVETMMTYEAARGWHVESVERDNRGFDFITLRSVFTARGGKA